MRREQLADHCRRFVFNIRSHYSGKLSEGTVAHYLNILMKQEFDCPWGNPMNVSHSADFCPFAQAACLSHRAPEEEAATASHTFGNFINDGRMKGKAMDDVFKMVPPDDMTKSGKAACYNLMWESMESAPKDFMTCESVGWCFRHLRYCPVVSSICKKPKESPEGLYGQLMSVHERMSGHDESSEELQEWTSQRQLMDLVSTMATSLPDEKGSKLHDPKSPPFPIEVLEDPVELERHEVARHVIVPAPEDSQLKAEPSLSQESQLPCTQPQPEPVAAPRDYQDFKSGKVPNTPAEILVNIAGTSCTDFAGYGKREGTAGKTMQAFMLWCLDVLVVRPMFIFTEIAGADLAYYEEKLSKFYGMWAIKVDPFEAGLPLRRVRLYVFMWCKLRASFSGSQKEFASLTRRKVMMKGEDLLCAEHDELRWKISRDNAERRGYVYGQAKPSTEFPVIPFQHQVTAQTFQRYQDQVRVYEEKGGCVQQAIFDVDHNASHSAGGWVIPTLVTHGTLVHAGSEEVFLASEHMLIQGEAIPGIEVGDNPFTCCLTPLIKNVMSRKSGRTCLKCLAGNATHLHSLFSVMLYCLSSVKAICYMFLS